MAEPSWHELVEIDLWELVVEDDEVDLVAPSLEVPRPVWARATGPPLHVDEQRYFPVPFGVIAGAISADDKTRILDGVVDKLFREVKVPTRRDCSWEGFSKALFQALRKVLLAHPHAISLLASRTASSPEALLPIDASLDVLCRAGFDPQSAVDGHRVLMSFTIGYAMSEVSSRPVST